MEKIIVDKTKEIVNKIMAKYNVFLLKKPKTKVIFGENCFVVRFFPKKSHSRSYELFKFEKMVDNMVQDILRSLKKNKIKNISFWDACATEMTFIDEDKIAP